MPNGGLTPRQRRFVEAYLLDLNATQAAIRAGYSRRSAGSQGHDLLKKPEIARAIEAERAALAGRTEITQDYVLKRLKAEAERTGPGASHAARVSALVHIGKHLGMFQTRPEPPKDESMDALRDAMQEIQRRGSKAPVVPSDPVKGG